MEREKVVELIAHLAEYGIRYCVGNEEICSLCREIVALVQEDADSEINKMGGLEND
jgi:hypothetical protein